MTYPISRKWKAVTPSNTTYLAPGIVGLAVTETGDVAMEDAEGNALTLSSVAAGTVLYFSPARVKATGTTATVVALY